MREALLECIPGVYYLIVESYNNFASKHWVKDEIEPHANRTNSFYQMLSSEDERNYLENMHEYLNRKLRNNSASFIEELMKKSMQGIPHVYLGFLTSTDSIVSTEQEAAVMVDFCFKGSIPLSLINQEGSLTDAEMKKLMIESSTKTTEWLMMREEVEEEQNYHEMIVLMCHALDLYEKEKEYAGATL